MPSLIRFQATQRKEEMIYALRFKEFPNQEYTDTL